jgi:hypothetical protein
MEQSCSSEANVPSAGQNISGLTLSPKAHYRRQKCPRLGALLPKFLYTQTCFQALKFKPNTLPERVNLEAMDG